MQSGKQEAILNTIQKSVILMFIVLTLSFLFFFKNVLFESTRLLKSFGESSINPAIAFTNNKPTFLEFYAEWCEVCKEMAPEVSILKTKYEKDINFVFLNVDNPKWENYIRKFEVNGIPQINLFDYEGNLNSTFIGKQKEKTIEESLDNLNSEPSSNAVISNSEFSLLKENKNYQATPRSHG